MVIASVSLRPISGIETNNHGERQKKRPGRKEVSRAGHSCGELGFIPSGGLGETPEHASELSQVVREVAVNCHPSLVMLPKR